MSQQRRGTVCVFISAVLYSIAGLCMKVIPWNGMSINGGRTAIALLVMAVYLWKTGHRLRMNRWIFLGSLAVCGTNVLFSLANKMTTAANAIVLQYTAPIFVMVLSAIFFRKKPGKLDLLTCAAVFGGVLCFFLESLSGGRLAGDILALISGVTYAVVFMLNDLPDGDPLSSMFFAHIISAAVGLPFLVRETEFTPTILVSMLALGVFQVGFSSIFLTEGLKTTPPVTASLVSGIEPVLNPVLVALFYGEMIGPAALIGAVIVVGSVVIYNVLLARHKKVG